MTALGIIKIVSRSNFGNSKSLFNKFQYCCTFNNQIISRGYPAPPKRFYKRTSVLQSDGVYEVALDSRKLKTPTGNVFKVENQMLALGVAAEWNAQKEVIQRGSMHLTALCNTVLDNPNKLTVNSVAEEVMDYLNTDVLLFFNEEGELADLQKNEWMPIIDWFCFRFNVDIKPSEDISPPLITDEAKQKILKYLLSYNFNSIIGFKFAVESLKSVILTLSCVDRKLNPEQAVSLSRLEEEFQIERWGRVEWAHDLNKYDIQSRVAAGILFAHLNSISEHTKAKLAPIA